MTKFLLSMLCIIMSFCAVGQGRTVKGKVSSNDGKAIQSASVSVSGTNKGTVTNGDGLFSIEVPGGKVTLIVTAVGYVRQEITLSGSENSADVVLIADSKQLDPVVVTALGINRKSRTLTYSTQNVSNEEISTVKNTNVMNSLNGKVAGLQVNRTSGGPGGSVSLILRGDKSTRNSQPLYVIDGLPIINNIGGPDAGLYNSAPDGGDILSTLNPDDIESISILKGASASALYGSQGGNGVILITTKKGKAGLGKIDFSSSVTFDNVNVLPKLQYTYGQTTPATANTPGSEDSWGAKNATQPGSNYLKNFFQTGATFINSLSLSFGSDKSSNFVSYSNTSNTGVMPTSTFKQHSLTFSQTSKFLNDKLVFDGTFLGSIQNSNNRTVPGIYFNPLTGLYLFPRGLDFASYQNYEYFSQSRYLYAQNWWNINYDKDQANGGGWGGQDYQQNPYWVLNRNAVTTKNTNAYASASLKYALNSWLTLQARGNLSYYVTENARKIYATTQSTLANKNGSLRSSQLSNTNTYADLILTGNREINKDWTFNFSLGTSIQDQRSKGLNFFGTPSVPNVFLESALDRTLVVNINNLAVSRQIQSVFGSAQFGYKNMIFVDVADRNDWSSTFAFTNSKKKGYNYFSLGVSGVLSEMFAMPEAINFAKLRVSYAQVGNDIAAFSTYPLYTFANGGQSIAPSSGPYGALGLKPEINKSFEIGTQWAFMKSRLNVDLTWYKSNVINQYFRNVTLAAGSSIVNTTNADVNMGNVQNTGIEASVSYRVVDKKDVKWTTTFNFARNRNKIVSLFDPAIVKNASDASRYQIDGSGGYTQLKKGGSFTDLYGRTVKTDAQGRMVVDDVTHLPVFVDSLIGNASPKFLLGWNNSITVKNFTINFLIDGKFGGKVLSITQGYLDQMGVSERTGIARDNGGNVTINNAVTANGTAWSGTVNAKDYYKAIGGKTPAGSEYIYDATAIRLREFSVAYRLPVHAKGIRDVRLGVVANNLFFFYRKAPFDPEQIAGINPGGLGVDAFGLPAYRSIGLSLKCSF